MKTIQEIYESIINDSNEYNKTIAIVPGAFKPPTAGHLDMIKKYSKLANTVIIIISDPQSSKSLRKTITGKEITPIISRDIFELYLKKYSINNAEIFISNSPSPVTAAFEYAENNLKNVNVIFGSSKKGNDYKRWSSAKKYFSEHNKDINILDPKEYSVDPLTGIFGDISATDIRNNVNDIKILKKLLPSKLNDNDIKYIQNILL